MGPDPGEDDFFSRRPSKRQALLSTAAYYVRLARRLDAQYSIGGETAVQALARYRLEWGMIEGALLSLQRDGEGGAAQLFCELASASPSLLELCVPATQRVTLLAAAAAMPGSVAPDLRPALLLDLGVAHLQLSAFAEARECIERG